MQKIVFNDRYDLTRLVLCRKKDVTRIFVNLDLSVDAKEKAEVDDIVNIGGKWKFLHDGKYHDLPTENRPIYSVGEVVAVAQSYSFIVKNYEGHDYLKELEGKNGYNNKMYVKPMLMPHQIEITHIRAQRLQDVTDEDCIREGAIEEDGLFYFPNSNVCKRKNSRQLFNTPRLAYANLIAKTNKAGTWENNPWVWAYSFKLVK